MNLLRSLLVALAVASLLTTARAAVIYTDIADQAFGYNASSITPPSNTPSYALDLDHNGVSDFNLYVDWMPRRQDLNPATILYYYGMVRIAPTSNNNVAGLDRMIAYQDPLAYDLPAGELIGPALGYPNPTVGYGGPVVVAGHDPLVGGGGFFGNGYLGLRFDIGGVSHYGWAHIQENGGVPDFAATLTDFAYESQADTPIAAGAVPEPATMSFLAAVSLLLLRRCA